jgi:hypothetical protein
MPSHQRNHTAVIRWLLFVCLLYSGSSLEAQIQAPIPVPIQEAPSTSTEASVGTEENLVTYQLKHAKAAEVLKIWQKLLGGYVRSIAVDERTNSIVLITIKATPDEVLATLALLDGELPSSIGNTPSPEVHSQLPLRKVTFKHARAADVSKIMRDLVGEALDDGKGFVVDERTNSLLYLSHDVSSPEFEEFCRSLDTPTPSPGDTTSGKSTDLPANGPKPQVLTFSIGFDRGESLESLKQRYNELEQQAHQLADKLKQSKLPSKPERTELKTAVRKSFEARQALQRAELADLAQRMKSMQQSIDMRDKLADKVVQRRVEDLLNPNLKWDLTEPAAIARTESSAKPKSIQEAVSAILLNAKSDSVPYKLAAVGILSEGKAEVGDFKEEIFEQVEAEARTFAHFQLISRRVADAAMADSRLKLQDLFVAENTKSLFQVMTKFGQSMDFLLLLRLEEVDVSRGEAEGNFRLTLRLVDQTGQAFTEQIDVSKGKRADDLKQSTQQSTTGYASPQELIDAVEQHGKSGSYEDFVKLFNDGGARDLAGSLLMQAVMQTSIDDLSRQLAFGGVAEVEPDFVAFRKVLQRWLPQSVTTAQQEAMGKGLSTIMSSIGGASPDHAALSEFVISLRESVAGISYHRKFCIEIMQAFAKLTKRKFVFFGNADQENDWQISPFSDRAIATLIDGSPGMATTITLQQINGTWRISSLFNERIIEAKPATTLPSSTTPTPSTAKTVTRRYFVGSFVTESFFTDNSETNEAYDKHEPEIEQSLQDLAKTVTATCSQPPKFVQVLSNSRCLLIGHTEAGHQEIADFMRDIGINNDRIRLRGVTIEITKDEAESLGIELTHDVLLRSSEDAEKLRAFQKDKKSDSENSSRGVHYRENSSRDFYFVAMDARIQSGTRTHMKTSDGLEQVPIAARIVPGTKEVQIRIDLYGYSNGSEHFHPQFQTLTDGQSVLFALAGDLWWLGTADIVRDSASAIEEGAEDAKPGRSDTPPTDEDENVGNVKTEWNDLLQLLPESGTALVMFSYEPEIKEQMLPVAKKVAEAASARLIELPQTTWCKIIAPPATHFVLMKDRQLVGTRTGLMTEARLQDFVAKANDWLTPQSTGIDEDSLVRIDCFINPGTDNIGSQHGGAYPLTTVVVAVHEDQALLFGPESIAEYIEKGYVCVAVVRDASGNQKQVPVDVLLKGPVKLLGRSEKQPKSAASLSVSFGDGTSRELPLPSISSIYPTSVTELLEAYDVGSAIYHISGVQGLKPVRLAAIKDAPIVNQRVLSGSFRRERHVPPLHGFRSPIDWQSQTVPKADGHIYGDNINGAEMFEVLCPARPAPCGFTFNEHGRLIGKYGLGSPTEKDMTHTVFKPDTTHSVLQAALEKISDAGLKAALAQTLEESHESLKTSMKVPSDAGETVNPLYSGHPISWWLDSYWDNATASPKTAENSAQEYVASEAIRKLRELPECKTAIETALEKWFASVEHEVNEIQLTRAAKCIVFAAGPKNQKLAVDYLFEIAKRVPVNPGEEDLGKWIDCWDDELDKAVKELVLNDELATQIADRLQTGNSAQRRFAVTFLLNRGASKQSDTPDQTEANAWFRAHAKLFYPAFEAALQDSTEAIRIFALIVLTGIDPHNSQLPFQLKRAVESDPSTQVRCVAIPLLCSKELAYSIEAQSVELQPLLMKALEADSSVDVRDAALGALMAMDKDSELVHATLLEWARCKERVQVEYALTLMLRNHEAGDRPQSIDELIELLSDPEWGTKVEVNYNNWSTHHRWARQYAIAILGQYAAHAHRAIPTLEAELARKNKDTLSFATEALDRVRGYCPDLPINKLQGEWEFVSLQKPEGSSPFFELQASSDQQPSSVITISGTQLKLGDRVLAELSHYRSGSRQGVALLLDPDGKRRHCHGCYNFKGGPSPEYKPNVASAPELLILEVSELHNDPIATQATKQIYEFRPVRAVTP